MQQTALHFERVYQVIGCVVHVGRVQRNAQIYLRRRRPIDQLPVHRFAPLIVVRQ